MSQYTSNMATMPPLKLPPAQHQISANFSVRNKCCANRQTVIDYLRESRKLPRVNEERAPDPTTIAANILTRENMLQKIDRDGRRAFDLFRKK